MAIDIISLVRENYGINISKCLCTREGWLIEEENRQNYLCKQTQLRCEKIIGIHIILNHLKSNGFVNIDEYIPCINNMPFFTYASSNYVLIRRKQGLECDINNLKYAASAAELLAEMHTAAEGFTASEAIKKLLPYHESLSELIPCCSDDKPEFNFSCYVKNDLGKTENLLLKRCEELKKFRKTAKRRNDAFDYAYLEVADYYCNLAERIAYELINSPYKSITAEYTQRGCICHRDFTGHNILLGSNNRHKDMSDNGDTVYTDNCDNHHFKDYNSCIINFENACIEFPIYDISNFIRRRMRKCGWSAQDAFVILDNYSKIKPITNDELIVLKLLLQFPQKLWRIINKYYNSRRSWCEKSCLAKLEEVKQERIPLEEFSRCF